jgi:hypothetical protein
MRWVCFAFTKGGLGYFADQHTTLISNIHKLS